MLAATWGELTGSPGFRDPGNYALAIFGDPAGMVPGPGASRVIISP